MKLISELFLTTSLKLKSQKMVINTGLYLDTKTIQI